MPDVQKVEITIPIGETDLLRILMSRYNEAELRKAGILPETSVIRSMAVESDGRISFRISAVSITDTASLLEEISGQDLAPPPELSKTEGEALTIDYSAPDAGTDQESNTSGCPVAEQTLMRIRKRKKVSNSGV